MTKKIGCTKPYIVNLFIINTKYGLQNYQLKFDQTVLINHITTM